MYTYNLFISEFGTFGWMNLLVCTTLQCLISVTPNFLKLSLYKTLGVLQDRTLCFICGYSDHKLDLEKVLSNGPITTMIFYFTE